MSEWIKCSERMPPPGERVEVYREGWAEDRAIAWWSGDDRDWVPVGGFAFGGVTNWRPLTAPPVSE